MIKVTKQLILVLEFLDKKGIIHRDIKSENILYNPENCLIKLIDFSVSRLIGKNELKFRNQHVGTYIAPEAIINSATQLSIKTEIYSLGCTLIEMAGGNAKKEEIPSDLPNDFKNFIQRCLTKNPECRAGINELKNHKLIVSSKKKKKKKKY
ncbi:hypothetical protein DICPUDRAFT_27259 [Dictyostelium purpureum]|uniref:Protein kinase domain-containing protein n=1 Tax=Dictyostelium purpureum TaxID=5786 RepID=F0Z9X4_DICPU|nr:uncharacterized protein DICPUDRAFT_27259 [Dictyostelium purpureum]EGC39289.1 hypothetical protein DICPUDRAFT_27259 [Dictyostelium purpureum]|eukprot:XP_003284193.1 hypothetical protein DICPUDRAFT_27259 [Dictyostelium purpureum]